MATASKRVLIVEDNLILSLLEEKLIRKMGHKVVGKVTSGEKALEVFAGTNPDIVIMDISLSGSMDGFEATNRMREIEEIPVIFVSGNSDQYRKICINLDGFNEFVSKPFTYKDLKEPIERIINRHLSSDPEPARQL